MIYINNGVIEKIINPIDLQFYIEDGYFEGKLPMPDYHREAIAKSSVGKPGTTTGKIYVFRGNIEITIYESELSQYQSSGWRRGRKKHTQETKDKLKGRIGTTTGRIAINNGVHNKFIMEDELDSYIQQGWYRGLKNTKN